MPNAARRESSDSPANLRWLLATASGAHAADQLSLAAVPLTAVVAYGADARAVGMLVAVQSAAWLLVSLPGGALVDRWSGLAILRVAMSFTAIALATVIAAVLVGWWPGLMAGAFGTSAGTVLFVLVAGSVLPRWVPTERLARANSRLELARATVTLGAPILVGGLVQRGWVVAAWTAALAAALLAALGAWAMSDGRGPAPRAGARSGARAGLTTDIAEGAVFVWRQPVLRAIAACAVLWNFAFFALVAAFVPFASGALRLSPASIGAVQAAYGAGMLAGALSATRLLRRVPPAVILIGGPACSVAAAVMLAVAPFGAAMPAALAAYWLIGFGPMLWLICQTSLRQRITPAGMLGRAGATIQVAIYGVRPLGALAGGFGGSLLAPSTLMSVIGMTFLASTLVVLSGPLVRLRAWPPALTASTGPARARGRPLPSDPHGSRSEPGSPARSHGIARSPGPRARRSPAPCSPSAPSPTARESER